MIFDHFWVPTLLGVYDYEKRGITYRSYNESWRLTPLLSEVALSPVRRSKVKNDFFLNFLKIHILNVFVDFLGHMMGFLGQV
jgi:hypothetical protein